MRRLKLHGDAAAVWWLELHQVLKNNAVKWLLHGRSTPPVSSEIV